MKLKIRRSTLRASERQTRHNKDLILFKTTSNGFLFEMVDSLRDMGESVVMLNPTDADSLSAEARLTLNPLMRNLRHSLGVF